MRLQNIKIWQHLIFSFPYEARKSSVNIFITCFQWNGISLDILSGNLNHLKLTLTSNWQRSQVGIMPLEIRSGKYLQVFVFYPASCLQNVTRKDALFLSCWIKKTEKKKKEESATGKKTEKVVNNQKLNLKKTKWKGMKGKKERSPVSLQSQAKGEDCFSLHLAKLEKSSLLFLSDTPSLHPIYFGAL